MSMATSFFYIYVMATSFFYIFIDIFIDIYIDIYINIDIDIYIDIFISFTNWRSAQSFYWTPFFVFLLICLCPLSRLLSDCTCDVSQ